MFHTARSVFACLAALQGPHICDLLASGSPGASGAMASIDPHAVGADSISARSSGHLRVSRGPGVPGPYQYCDFVWNFFGSFFAKKEQTPVKNPNPASAPR